MLTKVSGTLCRKATHEVKTFLVFPMFLAENFGTKRFKISFGLTDFRTAKVELGTVPRNRININRTSNSTSQLADASTYTKDQQLKQVSFALKLSSTANRRFHH